MDKMDKGEEKVGWFLYIYIVILSPIKSHQTKTLVNSLHLRVVRYEQRSEIIR